MIGSFAIRACLAASRALGYLNARICQRYLQLKSGRVHCDLRCRLNPVTLHWARPRASNPIFGRISESRSIASETRFERRPYTSDAYTDCACCFSSLLTTGQREPLNLGSDKTTPQWTDFVEWEKVFEKLVRWRVLFSHSINWSGLFTSKSSGQHLIENLNSHQSKTLVLTRNLPAVWKNTVLWLSFDSCSNSKRFQFFVISRQLDEKTEEIYDPQVKSLLTGIETCLSRNTNTNTVSGWTRTIDKTQQKWNNNNRKRHKTTNFKHDRHASLSLWPSCSEAVKFELAPIVLSTSLCDVFRFVCEWTDVRDCVIP